jgi:hypothetical protein
MRRGAFLSVLALLCAGVFVLPASGETTQVFKADFNEMTACPGADLCGKGVIQGFGTATTSLIFTSFVPGPGADCVSASADRTQTLDSDGSTLLITASGTVCGPGSQIDGTFTIVGGTGVFVGASGGGTLSGVTTNPHVVSQSVHLRGTITLP